MGVAGVTDRIAYQCKDKVGVLTINRPEKRNAMTGEMISCFLDTVGRAGEEGDAHVLIITGAGGSFCAGVDLTEVAESNDGDAGLPEKAEDRDRWWPVVECRIPTIAAIDGLAVGMGAEITCQCDIRMATPAARFAWNFARLGLVPDSGAGTWLLPRLVGVQQALKLMYTGGWMDSVEALSCGYVDKVVEPAVLMDEALALARAIGSSSLFSTRKIKRLVYNGLELERDEHVRRSKADLEACFRSNDHREGIAAFLEKREARFTGT